MMRLRPLTVVAFTGIVLVACGDDSSGSQADEPAVTATSPPATTSESTPIPTSTTAATTTPATSVDAVETPGTTVPDDRNGHPTDPIVRCADVPQIATEVLSEERQGNIDPVFQGVLQTYAAEHADTFGGLWIDRAAFGTVVLAFTDDPAPHLAALALRQPSPDDVHAVEPPPEITDDRPIGDWGVAFDVVQVAHTEAELVDAIVPVSEAAQALTGGPISAGARLLINRVGVEFAAPITPDELAAFADSITELDGIDPAMLCWSGEFVDDAPEPIQPGTPLDVIELPGDDGAYPADTPVTCGGLQFELGDLQQLIPSADVDPGLRAVLDEWLSNPEGEFWPQDGWSLLYERDGRASFIHVSNEGMPFIGAEMGPNGWIWAGAGGGGMCDVRLMLPPGVGEVGWELDPDAAAPDATATEIRVLVTERGCAGGQEMGDRLLGPQVVETDGAVRIAFGAIVQPGAHTCPGNPATPVVVELDAPLGNRRIRDGLVIGPITSLLGD